MEVDKMGMMMTCNRNHNMNLMFSVTKKQLTTCVTEKAKSLYWMKQAALKVCQKNWMNAFLDMSKATE